MTDDFDNLNYHYDNYIYPKPVENIDEEIIKTGKVPYADPNFSWHLLWPEKKYNNIGLNVLIAKCNPNHKFTGIDLSSNSIKHQKKLKERHKISNLDLICDDFRKIKFNKKFDYIISTGVIHHLINPETALNYFNNNLVNDGVIYLMVYGDKQSQSINEIKKVLKSINLVQDNKSASVTKNLFKNLNSNHPGKIFTNTIEDMKYDAGIIDLMLHKKEIFYSIENLIEILDNNNLVIKNFFEGKIASLTKFFINDSLYIKKIRELEINKKLELGQILNWEDRKIELILTKKDNLKESLIYNKQNIRDLYFYPNRELKYKVNINSLEIIENYSNNKYTYNFPNKNKIDWKKIFSGKFKFNEIFNINDPELPFIISLFELMIENFHIDISKNPVGEYLNHFAR